MSVAAGMTVMHPLQQAVVDWTEEQDQLEFDSEALEEDSL